MYKFEFTDEDLFINRLKTYPEYNVFVYQGKQYTNKEKIIIGDGGLVVYDINTNLTEVPVQPFLSSSPGHRQDFRTNLANPIVSSFSYDLAYISQNVAGSGSVHTFKQFANAQTGSITGSYAYSVPITRKLTGVTTQTAVSAFDIQTGLPVTQTIYPNINITASALQNVAKKYTPLSSHFIFESSSIRSRNLLSSSVNLINIPSVYYGSKIKKGSVNLKYYITGSLLAECSDKNQNGELIETTGSHAGTVVGVVLYDEGIIMLTSSAAKNNNSIQYVPGTATANSWLYYGTTLNDNTASSATLANASYDLNFKGTSYVTSMTMFAHAEKGHLNHSNNPTYRDLSETINIQTGSGRIFSQGSTNIKNIVTASYSNPPFQKTTYISKVRIYDENHNLIGVASLANPVKKTEDREYTFKLKLDI